MIDHHDIKEAEREARRKRAYWRAQRVLDTLRHRPVYLKDGTKLELVSESTGGTYWIRMNDGDPHLTVPLALAGEFESVDWERTDQI